MTRSVVLGLFSGLGFLDRAFEEEGFAVVRGPDLLWGHDIRGWHPPAGVFDGVIAGVPCQRWSRLSHMVRHAHGEDAVAPDMFPEFERCVAEARPRWFLTECSPFAPVPRVAGYDVTDVVLDNRWIGDGVGQVQSRRRRFCFGTRQLGPAVLDCGPELAALESPEWEHAVSSDPRAVPVAVGGSGRRKATLDVSADLALLEPSAIERAVTSKEKGPEATLRLAYHNRLDLGPELAVLEAGDREPTVTQAAIDNSPQAKGREIGRAVLDCSPDLAVFENGERDRAVIASGAKDAAVVRLDRGGRRRRQTLPGNLARRSVARCLELQGWPPDFLDDAPFTVEAKYRLVGNGVPRPLGRAVARAVKRAIGDAADEPTHG